MVRSFLRPLFDNYGVFRKSIGRCCWPWAGVRKGRQFSGTSRRERIHRAVSDHPCAEPDRQMEIAGALASVDGGIRPLYEAETGVVGITNIMLTQYPRDWKPPGSCAGTISRSPPRVEYSLAGRGRNCSTLRELYKWEKKQLARTAEA